jgi:hypothetical protein
LIVIWGLQAKLNWGFQSVSRQAFHRRSKSARRDTIFTAAILCCQRNIPTGRLI